MVWTAGFWAAGVQGNSTNMNYTVLGVGDATTDFPAAATTNIGALALSKNGQIVYYSTGTTWQSQFVGIDGTPVQGDIFYYNGTKCTRKAIGAANQFLHTNSTAADIGWVNGTLVCNTGTYSGDATNRAIPHSCGVVPKLLMLQDDAGSDHYFALPTVSPTKLTPFSGATVTETAIDATNFNVTSTNGNVTGHNYNWAAYF